MKYYDWQRTFSYGARLNVIVTMRGYGKTYGLRCQFIRDWIKDKSKFVVIVRNKDQLKGGTAVQHGFFDKIVLNNEFPDYIFKIEGKNAYIAFKTVDPDDKPDWQHFGYFVSIGGMQDYKGATFTNVKRIVFDEFIIDKRTRARYLDGEYDLFINMLSTIMRETPQNPSKACVYLLGNSCDLLNPYFRYFKINKEPKEGYTWYLDKTVLVHYAKDEVFSEAMRNTLVGKLLADSAESNTVIDNIFYDGSETGYIKKKPKTAKFEFGVRYKGSVLAFWYNEKNAYYYVTENIPNNTNRPIFAMTADDDTINYQTVTRGEKALRFVAELYHEGVIYFSSYATWQNFLEALSMFGLIK